MRKFKAVASFHFMVEAEDWEKATEIARKRLKNPETLVRSNDNVFLQWVEDHSTVKDE